MRGSSAVWLGALVGMMALIALILYAVRVGKGEDLPQPDPTPFAAATRPAPPPPQTTAPPPPPPEPARPRRKVAWIMEPETPVRSGAGLNMSVVETLPQWTEVYHVETVENWDRIALEDGRQGWVQYKELTFLRPANLNAPTKAELKVIDFYDKVARKDYSGAYSHLSPEWKRELPFAEFQDGYSRTWSLRTEIVNVLELGPDRYQVDVGMVADEEGRDVPYLGIYTVERVNEQLEMTSGMLKKQPTNDVRRPL